MYLEMAVSLRISVSSDVIFAEVFQQKNVDVDVDAASIRWTSIGKPAVEKVLFSIYKPKVGPHDKVKWVWQM
jgi:hypothetical protein